MFVLLNELAKYIQDLVNDNGSNVIITDDFQVYETYKVDADDKHYTPSIIRRLNESAIIDDSDIGLSMYRIYFYLNIDNKRDLERTFNKLSNDKFNVNGSVMTISPLFVNDVSYSSDGINEIRANGYVNVQLYNVLDMVLKGNEAVVKLDGETISHNRVWISNDKALIPNLKDNSGYNNPKLTSTTIGLGINYIKGGREELLLFEALNAEVNKTYELSVIIGSYEHLFNVYIRGGQIDLSNSMTTGQYTITFETTLPRVNITLNDEVIPLISYSFEMAKTLESIPHKDGDYFIHKSHPSAVGYTINTSFIMEDTMLTQQLLDDIHTNKGFENKYELKVNLLGNENKFNVILASGSYSMTETGELFFNCSFSEAN